MDIVPSTTYNFFEETEEISGVQPSLGSTKIIKNNEEVLISTESNDISDSIAAFQDFEETDNVSGFEPVLGGQLHEKAIWVDEAACIGCQYCVHVATNTFVVDERLGRSRVIRQNGDNLEIVQEAIDTCPVDCIHWVNHEDLEKLDKSLNRDMFQSLGKLPKMSRY